MTDPPMYNVASAVFCRSLAIVRSLPLPGCGVMHKHITVKFYGCCHKERHENHLNVKGVQLFRLQI